MLHLIYFCTNYFQTSTYIMYNNIYIYIYIYIYKGKFQPRTGHESTVGKQMYSCTLYWTSALNVGGWSTLRPGHFTPGKKTRFSLYRRRGGPPEPLWTGAENFTPSPPEFGRQTVQSLASRYTNCTIPAPYVYVHVYVYINIFVYIYLFI